ncbi:MAG: DUF354 domain-containing protein [Magnetococcales bacterium]|nr:DUF354 domain-containing protein [Magnetococcales bacterium]
MTTTPIRILFDIVHPAHVHFYKHMIAALEKKGAQTTIVAREKDVTLALLKAYDLPFISVGKSEKKNIFNQGKELLYRDWKIWRLARDFRPDVICTRSPAGVHVARISGAVGIFDTDDGPAAGIHYHAAASFAHIITTPACISENYGKKHIKYPGYKQSAYLHPDHFTPDPQIKKMLGVGDTEPYFLLRFVDMVASHDHGETGLSLPARRKLINKLKAHGRVFVTTEGVIPEEWQDLQVHIPPHRMHDALAFAAMQIGDSQTMAAESAFVGTPSLRVSTFKGRLTYLEELEHRYHLTSSFLPTQTDKFFTTLDSWLDNSSQLKKMVAGHKQLFAETQNITTWYVDYILEMGKKNRS